MNLQDEITQMQARLSEMEEELAGETELEEGQWVHYPDGSIIKIQGSHGTGWDANCNRWIESYLVYGVQEPDRSATKEEIKEALVAEAKRRGLHRARVKALNPVGATAKTKNAGWDYWAYNDALWVKSDHKGGSVVIYQQGQWAEKVEDDIVINGVKVTPEESDIKLDCGDTISKLYFSHFYALFAKYDLKIMRNGEDITPQIEKIAEHYESK